MSEAPARRWPAWLMAVLTVVLVAGTAGVGWLLIQRDNGSATAVTPVDSRPRLNDPAQSAPNPAPPDSEPETPPQHLLVDGDYYVHVKLIELRADPDNAWDARGGAPDIRYNLYWNDTLVHDGPTRDDRLIAEWDLIAVDVHEALLSGEVDIASAVKAPLVRAADGGVLRIEIYDDDDFTPSDEAGRFDLPMATLREGVNRLEFAEGGVVRIVLDLVPRETALPDLLQRASDR
ncbi:MAG: hypothetical protein AAGI46_05240 [Planctomycetota bacterium]